MIKDKSIAVVVPAFNEEAMLGPVIEKMPGFVDRIIVVDDCSSDRTADIARAFVGMLPKAELPVTEGAEYGEYGRADMITAELDRKEIERFADADIITGDPGDKLVLIRLKKNSGVGAAISRGYKWAKDHGIDCTAVMAGDGQMDPDELEMICRPVVEEGVDYVKGNRMSHKSASLLIPRKRFLGNAILTILTKMASGYWQVSDTQCGYTAISLRALKALTLYGIYRHYGMPNDMLVKLNTASCTLRELDIKPVYNIGERSKMRVRMVVLPIIWLLVRSFFRRLWAKYLFRGFHPLFILYHFAFILLFLAIPYGVKILRLAIEGTDVNPLTAIAFVFLFVSGFQSLMFAMWMDIQDNQHLYR